MKPARSKWLQRVAQWKLGTYALLFTLIVAVSGWAVSLESSRPRLNVKYSLALSFTEPIDGEAQSFAIGLLDLFYTTPTVLPGSVVQVMFQSANDYKFERKNQNYLGSLLIENNGRSAAKRVRLGLRFDFPVYDFKLSGTPNVETLLATDFEATDSNVPYRIITIDRLAPFDRALLTVSWEYRIPSTNSAGLDLAANRYYLPQIIFIGCDDSVGQVAAFVPHATLAADRRMGYLIGQAPTWRFNILPKEGAHVEVTPLDASQISALGVIERSELNPSSLLLSDAPAEYVPEEP